MKRYFLFLTIFIAGCLSLFGQEQPFVYQPSAKLPLDTETLKGVLPNGMTYYIRKNSTPAQKVELRLVFNAGSILETEEEQGLSHFLEHMSFTGTTSYPGNELVQKLEGIGVRLGYELNAATYFEETNYYIRIPVEHFDFGMTVMQEWAMNLALTDAAIDRERGVILEELRLGRGASIRVREQYLPVLFKGSAYPYRLPIGKADVIANFKYDVLRNFYKKWHRPDLTSLVVIGDIDPQMVERSIQERFASYTMPSKAEKRPSHFVPDHKDLRVVVATDKETSGCSVEVSYKHRPKAVLTQKDYLENTYHSLYSSMANARLSEQMEQGDAHFSDAEIGYSNYFRDVDTYSCYARCPQTDIKQTLTALTDENERILRYGFSETELNRAKAKLLAKYERWYTERDKTASDLLADECQVNYLVKAPMPGITFEYQFLKEMLPKIKAADINKLAKKYMTSKNRTIVITGPAGDGIVYPSEDELRAVVQEASKRPVDPYDEGEIVTELMTFEPKAGELISEQHNAETGVTEWTLSNGVKVVFKATDFKNGQVLFRSTSNGGYSMYNAQDDMSAIYSTRIQDESGVNGINNIQLKRLMAGKEISITQSLVLYNESMQGRFAPADAKEFFQLIYLYHTAPYFDRAAFDRLMKQERSEYANLLDSPNSYFSYEVEKCMSNGNSRRLLWPTSERLNEVNFERAQTIYKERFGNAAGFTYVFVGNVDIQKLKPYILTYLGGLPVNKESKPEYNEQNFTSLQGPQEYLFRKGGDNKANVNIRFVTPAQWDRETAFNYDVFIDILNTRLYESLRIEMSGVYGVRVSGGLNRLHEPEAKLTLAFGTNSSVYNQLYDRAIVEIKKLITEGPTAEEVNRVKEKRRVALESKLKENADWLLSIFYAYRNGDPVEPADERRTAIEQLSAESIRKAGEVCINPDIPLKFVLLPEEK